MKKITVTILTILICFQFVNINSYAKCYMDDLNINQINFEKLIKNSNQKSTIQVVDDKEVIVTRLEDFSEQNYVLEKNVVDKIKELVTAENSAINNDLLTYMLKQTYSLLSGTSPSMTKELTDIANKVYSGDLKKLSEEERIQAISEGKNKAEKALALNAAAGVGVWAVAKSLAGKGIGKIVEGAAAAAGVASLGTIAFGAALTSGALVLGGFCYNQFYVLPLSNKLRNLIEVHKDIFRRVREAVLNHKWIGKNVLVTATPMDPSCRKGYAKFHNVTGVSFSETEKNIAWEFAESECKFLGQDNYDCYNEAFRVINCLQENPGDRSHCGVNLYYTSANDRFNLLD